MNKDIIIGNYVLINKETKGLNAYAEFAREHQLPLLVYAGSMATGLFNVYTNQVPKNNYAQNPFIISKDYIRILEGTELKKVLKEVNKEKEELIKNNLKRLKTKHISLDNRKVELLITKNLLNTTGNYALLFNKNVLDNNKFVITASSPTRYTHSKGAVCAGFSKTINDIVAYIPKSWINYFGYNLTNLKCWMNFIVKCDVGFQGKMLGTKTLRSVFSDIGNGNLLLNNDINNMYINPDEDCYEIYIKGTDYNYVTYLYFILVRFIYSSIYWNIPFIAMKLKKNMPEATHWECLLIAHCFEDYNAYYSLTNNSDMNLAIPSAFNSPKNILSLLRSNNTSMNNAFKKYTENSSILRKAIKEEDYNTIQEIINKYKDVN